jgi:hypothetical protein
MRPWSSSVLPALSNRLAILTLRSTPSRVLVLVVVRSPTSPTTKHLPADGDLCFLLLHLLHLQASLHCMKQHVNSGLIIRGWDWLGRSPTAAAAELLLVSRLSSSACMYDSSASHSQSHVGCQSTIMARTLRAGNGRREAIPLLTYE